jgi:hypothetical protein
MREQTMGGLLAIQSCTSPLDLELQSIRSGSLSLFSDDLLLP